MLFNIYCRETCRKKKIQRQKKYYFSGRFGDSSKDPCSKITPLSIGNLNSQIKGQSQFQGLLEAYAKTKIIF